MAKLHDLWAIEPIQYQEPPPVRRPGSRGPVANPERDERTAQAALMARKRAAARDIQIPPCVNFERRASCENDLYRFGRTYFPHLYYLEPAEFQLRRIAKIQRLIKYGGQAADAEPRATGKTTDATIAGMWGALYGHVRYFLIIRANDSEASQIVGNIKHELETNALLLEDFPKVIVPIRALEGNASRGRQQTVSGERTRIEYHDNCIVLPTVEGSIASGRIIESVGILGKVRGRNKHGFRPDFALIDDPETEESVSSEKKKDQDKMLAVIQKSIGGLSGPGKKISVLWRGTILKRHCLIDQFTDIDIHPEWQGCRQAALIRWPDKMELWNKYQDIWMGGKQDKSDSDARKAMAFYIEHRTEMDAGAEVAWPANYITIPSSDGTPLEISSLQHLMNIICDVGFDAFSAEYQNDPPVEEGVNEITAKLIQSRLSGFPHQVVPPNCAHRIIEGIDIRGRELHFVVVACGQDFTSSVIDYGIRKIDAPDVSLADIERRPDVKHALELAVLSALRMRKAETDGDATPYRFEDGTPANIYMHNVDSGYLPDIVHRFCFESGPFWRPTKGNALRPGSTKYPDFVKPNDNSAPVVGQHWHASVLPSGYWLWHLDADYWKLFVHQRFLQDPGTEGALTIFGSDPKQHRMFSRHLTAEDYDISTGKWIQISRWNHFFDCTYEAFAGASMCGCSLMPVKMPAQTPAQQHKTRENALGEYRGVPFYVGDRTN
jgi:hypothetical protein